MVKRTRFGAWCVPLTLLPVLLVGCSGDDGDADRAADAGSPVAGSFVGEVSGTEAFVAVVAAPSDDGKDSGSVQIFVSDGRGLSEWFSGPISEGGFEVESDDGDAEAQGELTADSVTGSVVLPDGETVRYEATPPSGAAGLYELELSSVGELSGASAAGLGVTGQLSRGQERTGVLRLVDGKRLEFSVTRKRAGDLTHLRSGQVRLIILSDGELRGVAKVRSAKDGRSAIFIRSA